MFKCAYRYGRALMRLFRVAGHQGKPFALAAIKRVKGNAAEDLIQVND